MEKYVELIISSHDEDCLWKRRGCDGEAGGTLVSQITKLTCRYDIQAPSKPCSNYYSRPPKPLQ